MAIAGMHALANNECSLKTYFGLWSYLAKDNKKGMTRP